MNKKSDLMIWGRGLLICLIGAVVLACFDPAHAAGENTERPNVLVIMVDDLGYGDLSSYGATDMRTPHIDKLMSEGMRFNEFYSNCCVCSPTRAALLSGRYPEFVGIPGVVRKLDHLNWGFLTADSILLPELFQQAGYHTTLIGKWHLGRRKENCPNQRGFDEFIGFLEGMIDYWTHEHLGENVMRKNEQLIDPEGHATDLITQWSIEAIEQRADSNAPFFHLLAYNAPHEPIQPPPEWLNKVQAREEGISEKRALIVALIEHLDDSIGKVLQSLDATGLRENTIVVFTSDNGGKIAAGSSNGMLRSGKTHVYEGGIKVPTCVRWPGRIQEGSTTDFCALTMDMVPTLADICGIPIDHEIDGRSFKQLLLEGSQQQFEHPVFHMWRQGETKEAMCHGDWKLVRDKTGTPFELYNLAHDPSEQHDLAAQEPERMNKMIQVLEAHMAAAQSVPWKRPQSRPKTGARPR